MAIFRKKPAILVTTMAILLGFVQQGHAYPEIHAKAAALIEQSTGQIIFSKNGEQRMYPASTTKIMTLVVALENGHLQDSVSVSQHAASTEGSSMWLTEGEKLTLSDLLYGMMLVSGNDATIAVAEHISGSVPQFVGLMNKRAHEIGAVNTHFTNTSGLPDPKHFTTALDLAKITAYGFKNYRFADIVATKHRIVPWEGKPYNRELFNENKLLWQYDGANGVKTGYTEAAGPTLVSAANRNGIQLVAVILDSDQMWEDAKQLLDYGFDNTTLQLIVPKYKLMKHVTIQDGVQKGVDAIASEDIHIPAVMGNVDRFRTVVEVNTKIVAPINSGQKIGKIRIQYGDVEVASSDLVAASEIEQKSFFRSLLGSLRKLLAYVFGARIV